MGIKRKFLIGSIAVIIMLVLLFITLYIKTDLFKTKEQLFWKYFLSEKNEILNCLSNEDIETYNQKLKESSYIKEGKISIASKHKLINPINITLDEKGNNVDKYRNINIDFNYNDTNLNNTTIIEDDNYYLIKNDLIDSTNYIGFENENLKQLAKDLGIKNTDFIPDKIKSIDYFELFSINDSEMKHILTNYIPICRKYVNNKDYIKENNIKLDDINQNVTSYKVDITERQLNNLIIDVLKELSMDDKTLQLISNKIKIIDNENKYSDISNIKTKIYDILEFLQQRETTNDKFLSVVIYKNKDNIIKAEFILKDDRTISIQTNESNTIIIKQYDVRDKEADLKTIGGIIRTILNSITEITYSKNIEDKVTNKVDIHIICNIGIESITLDYNYVEQIKNNVEEFIRKNDVEYLDLKNINKEKYVMILKNILKINML